MGCVRKTAVFGWAVFFGLAAIAGCEKKPVSPVVIDVKTVDNLSVVSIKSVQGPMPLSVRSRTVFPTFVSAESTDKWSGIKAEGDGQRAEVLVAGPQGGVLSVKYDLSIPVILHINLDDYRTTEKAIGVGRGELQIKLEPAAHPAVHSATPRSHVTR